MAGSPQAFGGNICEEDSPNVCTTARSLNVIELSTDMTKWFFDTCFEVASFHRVTLRPGDKPAVYEHKPDTIMV